MATPVSVRTIPASSVSIITVPFPANESYGMQQAWRLFNAPESLIGNERYQIQKDYPSECHEMSERRLRAIGIDPNNDVFHLKPTPRPNFIIYLLAKKVFDSFEIAYDTHPKLTVTATIITTVSLAGSALFFFATLAVSFTTVYIKVFLIRS